MDVDSGDEEEGTGAAKGGVSDDEEPVQKAKSSKGRKKDLSDSEDEEDSDSDGEAGGGGGSRFGGSMSGSQRGDYR
jgi:hypothetical protein